MKQEEQNQTPEEKHYTPEEIEKYIAELRKDIDSNKPVKKPRSTSRVVRYFVIACIVIIFTVIAIVAVTSDNSTSSTDSTMTIPQTNEEIIKSIIYDELGSCNREGVNKISDITINDAGYGYVIDVHFAINDNLSDSYIKHGAQNDVLDTMKALYTSGFNVQWVDMYGTFSMRDKYGNISEDEVLHCRLGSETANKINWDNMYRDTLFQILDFLQWHPAFRAID